MAYRQGYYFGQGFRDGGNNYALGRMLGKYFLDPWLERRGNRKQRAEGEQDDGAPAETSAAQGEHQPDKAAFEAKLRELARKAAGGVRPVK